MSGSVAIPDHCYASSQPTAALRFIGRDGKRILQQAWNIMTVENNIVSGVTQEWRDVPLVEDGA